MSVLSSTSNNADNKVCQAERGYNKHAVIHIGATQRTTTQSQGFRYLSAFCLKRCLLCSTWEHVHEQNRVGFKVYVGSKDRKCNTTKINK